MYVVLFHLIYGVGQLNVTPEIEVLYMLFDRSLSIFSMTYLKQHTEYFHFLCKIQLDLPVNVDHPHLRVGGVPRQPEEASRGLVGQVGPAPPGLVLALRETGPVADKFLWLSKVKEIIKALRQCNGTGIEVSEEVGENCCALKLRCPAFAGDKRTPSNTSLPVSLFYQPQLDTVLCFI